MPAKVSIKCQSNCAALYLGLSKKRIMNNKIILLDYSMPDLNGPEVAVKVREILSST